MSSKSGIGVEHVSEGQRQDCHELKSSLGTYCSRTAWVSAKRSQNDKELKNSNLGAIMELVPLPFSSQTFLSAAHPAALTLGLSSPLTERAGSSPSGVIRHGNRVARQRQAMWQEDSTGNGVCFAGDLDWGTLLHLALSFLSPLPPFFLCCTGAQTLSECSPPVPHQPHWMLRRKIRFKSYFDKKLKYYATFIYNVKCICCIEWTLKCGHSILQQIPKFH